MATLEFAPIPAKFANLEIGKFVRDFLKPADALTTSSTAIETQPYEPFFRSYDSTIDPPELNTKLVGTFAYGSIGEVSGIITAITVSVGSTHIISITDLHADATATWDAMLSRDFHPGAERHMRELFSGDDTMTGTVGADTLKGFRGNDTIRGLDGDNHLFGKAGNDTLIGGADDDILNGGTGNDKLYGKAGDDRLLGWKGNDLLIGKTGNDVLSGDEGDDRLFGGSGGDHLFGGWGFDSGSDELNGGKGADILWDSFGNDTLSGGAGKDRMDGGPGDDTLSGGYGADVFIFEGFGYVGVGASGNDTILDFETIDRIGLANVKTPEDMTMSQVGADVLISLLGNSLTVADATLAEVEAAVFTDTAFISVF